MNLRKFIAVYEPGFIGNEKRYINNFVDSGGISFKCKYGNLFEERFSKYLGGGFLFAVSSGTFALKLSFQKIGIKK